MWFNADEDDLEDGEAVVPPSDKMKSEEDLMEPISKFMERKKCTYEKAFSIEALQLERILKSLGQDFFLRMTVNCWFNSVFGMCGI